MNMRQVSQQVSNLVFYAQSTITVISGQKRQVMPVPELITPKEARLWNERKRQHIAPKQMQT